MTVEIKEIVLKTEISTGANHTQELSREQLDALKRQIVQECLGTLKKQNHRNSFNR